MKNPKNLSTHYRKEAGTDESILYQVGLPTYVISQDGMVDGKQVFRIPFCKGTKESTQDMIQEGVFTESLLQACVMYLEDVNKGKLASIDTTEAIQHIKAALGCLDRRQQRRKENGTQFTAKEG